MDEKQHIENVVEEVTARSIKQYDNQDYECALSQLIRMVEIMENRSENYPYINQTFISAFVSGFDQVHSQEKDGLDAIFTEAQRLVAEDVIPMEAATISKLSKKEIELQQKQIMEEFNA